MTLQEAKEQYTQKRFGISWVKFCKDADLSDMEYALDSIAQSCAQEAREQAIDECIDLITERIGKTELQMLHSDNPESYKEEHYYIKIEECKRIRAELNLKEKSICTHDKEPVTGSDGCEECPDCGKYGEDC